jgi:branched-chain amino acid transport system substrate-binding protein
VGSLSGPEAGFGDSTDKAIRLAVDEQNARGGVKGRPVAVRTYDDQGKPEEAAIVTTRLVVEDKVQLLLGEVASARSLAMAPIADRYQTPMITPASTNPRVTREGDVVRPYVFRVCFIDSFQGTVMAKFARETLKLQRVAVLRDVGNDYSVGLADYFLSTFKELGGELVDDQSYKGGDQDFRAQLGAIRRKKPEAIYVPGYSAEVALIGRQARELGLTIPFLGGDGWDSSKLPESARGALEGSYFSSHYSAEDPSPRIVEFVKRYRARYGAAPEALAALGYDAAGLAMDAMERARDLTGPAIREAVAATRSFAGVTGGITLDADHNAVKAAVVLKIEGSGARYVGTVQPN